MKAGATTQLDQLMARYLRLDLVVPLRDDQEISSFGAANWRIIDLAIAVETEFGVPLDADKALALKTIGDWRALVRPSA
jgi:hypothetical protein